MARGLRLVGLAGAVAMLALPAAPASAELVFASSRCDQGGLVYHGPAPPTTRTWCRPSIFRIHDDGTGLRRLTTGARPEENDRTDMNGDGAPTWSPDGETIVFSREVLEPEHSDEGTVRRRQLWTMRADGREQRALPVTVPRGVYAASSPAWSPDGTLLAFDAQTGGLYEAGSQVYTVPPRGGVAHQVSPRALDASRPAFTADGRRLAFYGVSHEPVSNPDAGTWMVNADGSSLTRLTLGDDTPYNVSFAPDGHYAAVGLADGRLYTMKLDGSELTRRTDRWAMGRAWSPIGPTLFFSKTPNDSPDEQRLALYRVLLVPGSPTVPVTLPDAQDTAPAWSARDGLLDTLPILDVLPPAVVLDVPPGGGRSRKLGAAGHLRGRLPFFAVDLSGIRRVDASLALRVHGGCRYRTRSRLHGRSGCKRPRYWRVRSAAEWRKTTDHLPRGTYEVRFRTTDVKGNRTRHPKRRVVKLS